MRRRLHSGIGLASKGQVLFTLKKVFPYILVGVGIGAVIHNWIPEAWIETILGSSNPFGVLLATLVGVPMYADIFGTIPVAEALLAKGAQLGTILSFMMAVTTLSLPSMIMLRKAGETKAAGAVYRSVHGGHHPRWLSVQCVSKSTDIGGN